MARRPDQVNALTCKFVLGYPGFALVGLMTQRCGQRPATPAAMAVSRHLAYASAGQ